jgi:hypothetical protein
MVRARDALKNAGFVDLVHSVSLSYTFQWLVIHDVRSFDDLNDSMGIASGWIARQLGLLIACGYLAPPDGQCFVKFTDRGRLAADIVRTTLETPGRSG